VLVIELGARGRDAEEQRSRDAGVQGR